MHRVQIAWFCPSQPLWQMARLRGARFINHVSLGELFSRVRSVLVVKRNTLRAVNGAEKSRLGFPTEQRVFLPGQAGQGAIQRSTRPVAYVDKSRLDIRITEQLVIALSFTCSLHVQMEGFVVKGGALERRTSREKMEEGAQRRGVGACAWDGEVDETGQERRGSEEKERKPLTADLQFRNSHANYK